MTRAVECGPSVAAPAVPGKVPLAIAFLITYGSLYPFAFSIPSDLGTAVQALLTDRRMWTSLSDVLGNVGLFVPLGTTALWWSARVTTKWIGVAGTIAASFVLAVLLQFVQVFVPARSVAMSDVAWNVVGACLGVAGAFVLEDLVVPRNSRLAIRRSVVLPLLALWVVGHLAPFVPSLDLGGIAGALKPLFIAPALDIATAVYTAAQMLLVGRLLERAVGVHRAAPALLLATAGVLSGRVLVANPLDLSIALGLTAGAVGWVTWHSLVHRPLSSPTLLVLLLAAYSAWELSPFSLRSASASFSWLPFAASLEGSMLANLRAIASSAFTLGGCIWLIHESGWRVRPAAVVLAVYVLLLEWLQTWIVGRTASITESVLVLVAGFALRESTLVPEPLYPSIDWSDVRGHKSPRVRSAWWTSLVPIGIAVAVTVVGLKAVLRLPGIPYNVAELFLNDGSTAALTVFALALLWIGAGPLLLAHWLSTSRRPWLALPVGLVVLAMVSRTLLKYSVTYESLDDILGSNALFHQVTQEGLWGPFWRDMFLRTSGTEVVPWIERRVRYIGLYSPLAISLTLGFLLLRHKPVWPRMAGTWAAVAGVAALCLWICKLIVIDMAATDNLTELIAREGPFGLGGTFFLFLLSGSTGVTVASLLRAFRREGSAVAAVLFALAAIPLGWLLLGVGLESQVQKYGQVFPAVQFLLGPDRQHSLTQAALFARWAVVHGGTVAGLVVGAWAADRIHGRWRAST